MKLFQRLFIGCLLLIMNLMGFSQDKTDKLKLIPKKTWFISSSVGIQMSGIKDEDFISHNRAPALLFNVGVWFTPEVALSVGYKGPYFNTIADNDKHHYNYINGEILLNVTELFMRDDKKRKWSLIIHPGAGFFTNLYYGRPNVCLNVGIINSVKLSENINIYCDLGAIAGWDIYQGDDDILPSITFGVNYNIINR